MTKDEWNKGDQLALVQRIFDRHNQGPSITGLTALQRYIYLHFLNHRAKRSGEPCRLPEFTGKASDLRWFLQAVKTLEQRRLITVDRSPGWYKRWTISGPELAS